MATDSDKYDDQLERESRHSALEELKRDERRPAVILLSALLLAAIFFAFGIMVGRWTAQTSTGTPPLGTMTTTSPPPPVSNAAPPQQTSNNSNNQTAASPTSTQAREPGRRFNLVVENLPSEQAAQSLVKSLERIGYREVRTVAGATAQARSQFSVVIGRYTREEAEAEARKLRDRGGPRLKDVRVIEEAEGRSSP